SLAGIVMPPLVTALVQMLGWRGAFVVFALIVAVVLTPIVILFLKNRPEDIGEVRDGHHYTSNHPATPPSESDSRLWRWQEMLRSPAFWSIGVMFGAMGCVYSAVMLHLFGHMKDIGTTGEQAAIVLSVTALFSALGKPLVGWMSDWLGARITIWMALIVQAISLVMFANAESYVFCLIAGCTYGFGYAGMSPLRTFSLSVAIGNRSFGKANGVLRLVELPLVISASPLAGYIYDSTGSYQSAFIILAGLMAASCAGPFFIQAGGAIERRKLAAGMATS
ncbi:MAG: MFS transporter, partial [Proteobacteria bacterium]|nr:MFS transporter [Pseudomonadota bacterium]